MEKKNNDNICVGCGLDAETMSHFIIFKAYCKESEENNLQELLGNDYENQFEIARKVQTRMKRREMKLFEDGLASHTLTPLLQ